VNKPAVLSGTALFLAVVYFLFGRIQGVGTLIVAATAYGFCMGVSLPLVNALIFDISAPALRGFNSNMGLFMMDAGFFSSPYLAAFLLSSPDHFPRLFFLCAWLAVGVAFLAAWLGRKTMEPAALRISGGDP
jgi:MFS family permease